MARFFVFLLVFGGLGGVMYVTKPDHSDFLDMLQERAPAVRAQSDAFQNVRLSDPVDKMLSLQTPMRLFEHTTAEDYYVARIFTTEYEDPRWGWKRVRTVGVLGALYSF